MGHTRGNIIGYNPDRMAFEFTLTATDGRVVGCQISCIAMDYLDGARGTPPSEREAQFIRLRDAIEKIAADLLKVEGAMDGSKVRIFGKHVPEGRVKKSNSVLGSDAEETMPD